MNLLNYDHPFLQQLIYHDYSYQIHSHIFIDLLLVF